jgi:hypothetical protein
LLRAADNKLDPIHIGRGTAVFSSNKASTIALPFRVGTKLIQEYMPDRLNKQETVDAAIQDNYRLVRDIVVDRNNKAVDNASYIVFQITPLDVDAGLKRLVEGGLKSYKAHVDSIAKLSPGTSPIGQSVWYASMGSEIARDLKFILDADKQAGSAKAVEAFGIYLKRLAEIHKDTESGFKFQDATIDRLLSDINDESAGGLAFRSTEALPASKAEILTLYLDRIQRRIKANAISYSGVSYHSNYVNAVVLRDLTSTIDRAEIGKVNPALKAQLSGLIDVYITGTYEQSDGTKEVLLAGELANDLPTRLKQLMGNDWNVSGAVMKATLAGRYVLKTDATSLKLVRPADVIRDRVSENISSITDSDKLLLALRQGYEDIDNLLTTGVQDDPSTPGRLQQDAREELFKLIDAAHKPFVSTAEFNAFVANKTLVKNGTKIAILEPKPEASSTTPAKP